MSHQEEFYPMPFFATLAVDDLEVSTHWYTDVLGFRLVFRSGNLRPSHPISPRRPAPSGGMGPAIWVLLRNRP